MLLKTTAMFLAILFATCLTAQVTSKAAEELFQKGAYEQALKMYEKLYSQDSNNVLYTHRLGVCHLLLTYDKTKSIPYLEKASKMKGAASHIFFDLGSAYRFAGKFDQAKEELEKFVVTAKTSFEKTQAEMMLKQLENVKTLMSKPLNVEFKNMGPNINTPYDDYFPYVDTKNSWMIFNSHRIYNKDEKMRLSNVYNSDFKHNEWKRSVRSKTVNSSDENFIAGKSASDQNIFIKPMRIDIFQDIMVVDIVKGSIGSRPTVFTAPINTKDEESGATLSPTGDTLIFASARKGGAGGLDLYISMKLPDKTWSTPKNLADNINTTYNEDFPMFSPDGKTLYFASQGHTSMGGYDIFVSKLNQESGTWSDPVNIGYPVNNIHDNFTICYTQNSRYAYVADIRPEGMGGYDIYQVVFKNEEHSIYLVKGVISKARRTTKLPLSVEDNIKISIFNAADNQLVGTYKVDISNGHYLAAIAPGAYILKVESATCEELNHPFTVDDILAHDEFELEELVLHAK